MKDSEIQELKPLYIHDARYSANDEITLVDLAMVLVRHKRMIAVITTFIIAIGVTAALFIPKSYSFSTSIETGSQIINGTIIPFESPETLLAKMQHVFIPQILNEQRQSNPEDKKKYKIKASIPKSSVIIVLEIKGSKDEADLMTALLQKITRQAIQDHQRIYDAVKKNLVALNEQAKTELLALDQNKDNVEEKMHLLKGRIEILESQLANLRNTREILPPMKSIEPTGTSKKLIVIISAFAGIFLGVISAFLADFSSKVREAGRQQKI